MSLSRLALLPTLLALPLLLPACSECEGEDCGTEEAAPLREGSWTLRFVDRPSASPACARMGLDPSELEDLWVELATPSAQTFVMDLEGLLIRGERVGALLLGEGDIPMGGPGEAPKPGTGGTDTPATGCDEEDGEAAGKCVTGPDEPPAGGGGSSLALEATVASPERMAGELFLDLVVEGERCEAVFPFQGTWRSEGRDEAEPVPLDDDDEAPHGEDREDEGVEEGADGARRAR
jgi:hypothetical protein